MGSGEPDAAKGVFSNPDDPKWAEKTGSEKNPDIFRKSAFADDVESVFHPLISGAAVFRRCKLDRIPKLAEQTRDSPTSAIEVQMVRISQFGVGFFTDGFWHLPYVPTS